MTPAQLSKDTTASWGDVTFPTSLHAKATQTHTVSWTDVLDITNIRSPLLASPPSGLVATIRVDAHALSQLSYGRAYLENLPRRALCRISD